MGLLASKAEMCHSVQAGPECESLSQEGPQEGIASYGGGSCRRKKTKTMGRRSSFKFTEGDEIFSLNSAGGKTKEDSEFIAGVLRGNPNLQRLVKLSDSHIQRLVDYAWKEDFATGQMLMSEGDLTNELFYIVADGSFEIVADTPFEIIDQTGVMYLCRPEEPDGPMENRPMTTRIAGRGLCIGDSSMVYNQPRLVTAQAREKSTVWAISQSEFKVIQNQAMQDTDLQASLNQKSAKDEKLIADSVRLNANLQRLVPLNAHHITQVVSIARKTELAEGHVLMYEGDLNAEAFYIVGDGSLEATGSEPFEVVRDGEVSYFHRAAHTGQGLSEVVQNKTVRVVGKGHCFGEISMLHCAPRFATMKALKTTVLWVIDRANFQMIQMKGAEEHMKNRVKYLENSVAGCNLPQGGKEALAGLMEPLRFTEGEMMLRQGVLGTALYILYDGTVDLCVEGEESKQRLEATPSESTYHYFGEGALKKDTPHPATVCVVSAIANVLVLERSDFMAVWDQLIEGIHAPVFERLYTRVGPRKDHFSMDALTRVGLLGVSTFGPVELVQDSSTKETYALKTMSKGLVARRGMIQSVAREKGVWEMVASPFVVKYVTTLKQPQSLGWLLEVALGGELSSLYTGQDLYGSTPHTQYYVAGIVCALECLHRLKVAYRNLKPQNVLITHLGHPKLTDMGLAKVVVGQTFTMCGIADYLAPEILAGTGHTRAVDWWALGVLIFELMAGHPPFESDHPMRVYWNVMRGIARVQFPDACAGAVGNLITLLLKPQAIERLPMRQGGITNIETHEWLSGFDWSGMRLLSLAPPLVPKLKGTTDLSHFSASADDLPVPVELHDPENSWDTEFCSD